MQETNRFLGHDRVLVQDAVRSAENFMSNMKNSIGEVLDLRLEEVELSEDESKWLITLGFVRPADNVIDSPSREYRRFEIDAATADVKSMKMRTV